MDKLLSVKDLKVSFGGEKNSIQVINGVSFELAKGETLGLVGESGSGKSVTSLAVMRLLPTVNSHVEGEILFEERDVLALSEKKMEELRGNRMAMIFQEPMTSLNPVISCGKQIMEPMLLHTDIKKPAAKIKAIHLLELCGIPDPEHRFHEYPHQMSGGMRQRIMIAMALACNPDLLIADEPTTALDVTIQAQILELMKKIKEKNDMSIIMITHDLGVVSDFCDRVIIMYTGMIVESANTRELFEKPLHPYTQGLMKAIPKLSERVERLPAIEGTVPDADKMPEGCTFHPRCPYATERCAKELPKLYPAGEGRMVRCFLHEKPLGEKGENE
ncbi:MAG: ABC transporter ATP-binding protein [Firmicutes bacterium]|nr:ABC transporter ATP-binding protein [Bacillota bacterium]